MTESQSAAAVRRQMRAQANGCGTSIMNVSRGVIYSLLDEADRLESEAVGYRLKLDSAEALLRCSHEFWGCLDEIGTNPASCGVCAYFRS